MQGHIHPLTQDIGAPSSTLAQHGNGTIKPCQYKFLAFFQEWYAYHREGGSADRQRAGNGVEVEPYQHFACRDECGNQGSDKLGLGFPRKRGMLGTEVQGSPEQKRPHGQGSRFLESNPSTVGRRVAACNPARTIQTNPLACPGNGARLARWRRDGSTVDRRPSCRTRFLADLEPAVPRGLYRTGSLCAVSCVQSSHTERDADGSEPDAGDSRGDSPLRTAWLPASAGATATLASLVPRATTRTSSLKPMRRPTTQFAGIVT
jgi:hypothetical protein